MPKLQTRTGRTPSDEQTNSYSPHRQHINMKRSIELVGKADWKMARALKIK